MSHTRDRSRAKVRSAIIALLEGKTQYGYELSQQIRYKLAGSVQLMEGGIYPMLHALEQEGVLTAVRHYTGKRVRKYYSLSKKSKQKYIY